MSMVYKNRVKQYFKQYHQKRVSAEALDFLERAFLRLCAQSAINANHFKTIKPEDIPQHFSLVKSLGLAAPGFPGKKQGGQ